MRRTLVSFIGGLALVAAMALPAGALPVSGFHHGGGGFHGGRGGWEHPHGPRHGYEPGHDGWHDRRGWHDRPGHDPYRWGPGPGDGNPYYGPDCPPMYCHQAVRPEEQDRLALRRLPGTLDDVVGR
jgi:hypothetical protein